MKLNLLLGYSSLWDVKPQFGETTGKKRSPTVTDRNCDNVSSTPISGFYAFNKIRIIVILLHVNWFILLFFFLTPPLTSFYLSNSVPVVLFDITIRTRSCRCGHQYTLPEGWEQPGGVKLLRFTPPPPGDTLSWSTVQILGAEG